MWQEEEIHLLLGEIESRWGQGAELLRRGPSLLFRCQGQAIRVSHTSEKSAEDVQMEARLLLYLRKEGMLVPRGEATEISGFSALSYPWIEDDGRKLSWEEFGQVVGKLHSVPPPPWLREYSAPSSYRQRAEFLLREEVISPEEGSAILSLGDISQGSLSGNRSILLHGDLHTGNLLSSSEGLYLIDWEDASSGPPEVDWSSILQRPRYFGLPREDFAAFERGYEERIHSLPLAEEIIRLRIAESITHLLLGGRERAEEGRRRLGDVIAGRVREQGFAEGVAAWRDV